ncbi:MAG: hypothetical protein ACJAVV_002336 [Alphaproteobacteria bacterium]|jgi:hypothetical protein
MKTVIFAIIALCAGSYLLVQSEMAQTWIDDVMPGNKITETAEQVVDVIDMRINNIKQELSEELSEQYAKEYKAQHKLEIGKLNEQIAALNTKVKALEKAMSFENVVSTTTMAEQPEQNDNVDKRFQSLRQPQEVVLHALPEHGVQHGNLRGPEQAQLLDQSQTFKKEQHLRQLRLQEIASNMQNISLKKGS